MSRDSGPAPERPSRCVDHSSLRSPDLLVLSQFGWQNRPDAWTPSPAELEHLQALSRRLEDLQQMITQERNRLDPVHNALKPENQAHIQFLNAHPTLADEVKQLDTIIGIGPVSAACIRAEIGQLERVDSARQLAAYSGLTPQQHQFGTSVHGKARLSKIGNAHLRHHLYFPALVAIRHSPAIARWRKTLLANGKTKMHVVAAVMHKLLRICFAVLKSGQPFDPTLLEEPHPSA